MSRKLLIHILIIISISLSKNIKSHKRKLKATIISHIIVVKVLVIVEGTLIFDIHDEMYNTLIIIFL